MLSVPGYRIEAVLHDGRRSTIYKGRRLADGGPVVVKCPKSDFPSADEIARFENEYLITGQIRSAAVIPPERYGMDGSRPYMVLPERPGLRLSELMGRPLDLPAALTLMLATLEAVGDIHQAGVVHKNLEPNNVLVSPDLRSVTILDFKIASRLSREQEDLVDAHALEGPLRYISPERTGRMNRVVDYRTDFYTLGTVFYELLVGSPVFDSGDPMELIHHHIAKRPVVPEEARRRLPEPVLAIVLKLLAKTAEERYQSTGGVSRDLQRCLSELRERGTISPFTPGENDASERFTVVQRLYGRHEEIAQLMRAFEAVVNGDKRLVLVVGPSGIGKSALVREVQKPILEKRGYFACGKCDQLQRNIPYAAFTQALRDLIGQILTEGQQRVASWRGWVRDSLGANARVVVDVVPELELLTGPLPMLPELEPQESQIRFNDAFRKLLRIFASASHPLVLFLDDLQWIDAAGLGLMRALLEDPGLSHVMFVGSYRDNEVGPAHPVALAVEQIRHAGTPVETVTPAPLTVEHVRDLVSDTLQRHHADIDALVVIVRGRTEGNPFFVGQYLDHLHREGVIRFLHASSTWTWNPDLLAEMGVSEGIVELMRAKILKTPASTQETLRVAACIGTRFDLRTLSVVSGKPLSTLAEDLYPAMRDGVVVLVGAAYKLLESPARQNDVVLRFAHDRVHQAAHELLSPGDRQRLHLQIGRVLLKDESQRLDDKLFDVVDHLNQGWELIDSPAERWTVLRLNLTAGRRAKLNAAYDVALRCLRHAMRHLPADAWEVAYDLTGELHIERAESEYLGGHFDVAEQVLADALARLTGRVERAAAYAIRIPIETNQGRPGEAIRLGLEALAMFGVELSASPTPETVTAAIVQTRRRLEAISHAELLALPPMVDLEKLAIMRIINRLGPPAYFTDQGLYSLIHCLVIELSLEHGHASESVRGYSVYGLILGSEFHAYEEGSRFGALAIQLADRLENVQMKGVSRVLFGCFVGHWSRAAAESLTYLQDSYSLLREAGNVVLASFALCFHAVTLWIKGEPIGTVAAAASDYLGYLRQVKYRDMIAFMECLRSAALALSGGTASTVSLDGPDYREEEALASMRQFSIKTPLHWYYLSKMQLHYLFGDLAGAARMGRLSAELLTSSRGSLHNSEHFFYTALTALGRADASQRALSDPRVEEARRLLRLWAEQCPDNFRHKHLLVEAECARVQGNHEAAMERYDRALAAAREQRNLQMEALAAELAGRYYQARDRNISAAAYLRQAHHAYLRWGATAKAAELQRQHASLLGGPVVEPVHTTLAAEAVVDLDIGSIIKATRAIAEEIVLERLVRTFVRIVIESAGAETGFLIFAAQEDLRVVARGHVDGGAHATDDPLEGHQEIAPSIVRAVIERQDCLVYDDAGKDPALRLDPVVLRRVPRSVLCFPVLQRGQLVCVVYLENNLASGVFTAGRVEVLRVLAAQAAISIENARLYAGLQEKVSELETAQREVADKERLKQELEIASRIQTGILPRTLAVRGLEIAATMRPATEVGGDYYDVIPTSDGCWIGIGDVAGHGLPSGLVMVMIQSGVAALARQEPDAPPGRLLCVLNELLFENIRGRLRQDEHATLVLIRYRADGRLTFAGAHEQIVVCRASTGACELVDTPGAWVGGMPELPPPPEGTCKLEAGDVMLLYTDGVLEARNVQRHSFGLERLCAELSRVRGRSVEAIRDHLLETVMRWVEVQDDDVTLLVARYRG
jgi:predicted ATPase/serine phosphatase RsbU (regulator of sigma subunit)/tRNA A-37 threonylcarbamoyl transferase component Bud32